MAASDLTRALDKEGAEYELLPHAHTETATAEAEALGVDPGEVGKTLVLTTPEGNIRAVLPASAWLDVRKVRELLGVSGKRVHLLNEEQLKSNYGEFELGSVPPLGGGSLDRSLAERESIFLEASSHDESVRIKTADLVRLTLGAGLRAPDAAARDRGRRTGRLALLAVPRS